MSNTEIDLFTCPTCTGETGWEGESCGGCEDERPLTRAVRQAILSPEPERRVIDLAAVGTPCRVCGAGASEALLNPTNDVIAVTYTCGHWAISA